MATLLRSAGALMCQYAAYHRDRRNIATHMVGVPLIVFALGVLLARLELPGGSGLTLAWAVWGLSTLWYVSRGHMLLGLAVSALNAGLFWLAQPLAHGTLSAWLGWGLGLFALGWVIQFVGHYYEGRKPAFADDLVGLLAGPMFVTAEALFALGLALPLRDEIERRAGPTHLRDLAQTVR